MGRPRIMNFVSSQAEKKDFKSSENSTEPKKSNDGFSSVDGDGAPSPSTEGLPAHLVDPYVTEGDHCLMRLEGMAYCMLIALGRLRSDGRRDCVLPEGHGLPNFTKVGWYTGTVVHWYTGKPGYRT